MATRTFYVLVEIKLDELFAFDEFTSELLGTSVYVELSENEGFEGVVTRVASKSF